MIVANEFSLFKFILMINFTFKTIFLIHLYNLIFNSFHSLYIKYPFYLLNFIFNNVKITKSLYLNDNLQKTNAINYQVIFHYFYNLLNFLLKYQLIKNSFFLFK